MCDVHKPAQNEVGISPFAYKVMVKVREPPLLVQYSQIFARNSDYFRVGTSARGGTIALFDIYKILHA